MDTVVKKWDDDEISLGTPEKYVFWGTPSSAERRRKEELEHELLMENTTEDLVKETNKDLKFSLLSPIKFSPLSSSLGMFLNEDLKVSRLSMSLLSNTHSPIRNEQSLIGRAMDETPGTKSEMESLCTAALEINERFSPVHIGAVDETIPMRNVDMQDIVIEYIQMSADTIPVTPAREVETKDFSPLQEQIEMTSLSPSHTLFMDETLPKEVDKTGFSPAHTVFMDETPFKKLEMTNLSLVTQTLDAKPTEQGQTNKLSPEITGDMTTMLMREVETTGLSSAQTEVMEMTSGMDIKRTTLSPARHQDIEESPVGELEVPSFRAAHTPKPARKVETRSLSPLQTQLVEVTSGMDIERTTLSPARRQDMEELPAGELETPSLSVVNDQTIKSCEEAATSTDPAQSQNNDGELKEVESTTLNPTPTLTQFDDENGARNFGKPAESTIVMTDGTTSSSEKQTSNPKSISIMHRSCIKDSNIVINPTNPNARTSKIPNKVTSKTKIPLKSSELPVQARVQAGMRSRLAPYLGRTDTGSRSSVLGKPRVLTVTQKSGQSIVPVPKTVTKTTRTLSIPTSEMSSIGKRPPKLPRLPMESKSTTMIAAITQTHSYPIPSITGNTPGNEPTSIAAQLPIISKTIANVSPAPVQVQFSPSLSPSPMNQRRTIFSDIPNLESTENHVSENTRGTKRARALLPERKLATPPVFEPRNLRKRPMTEDKESEVDKLSAKIEQAIIETKSVKVNKEPATPPSSSLHKRQRVVGGTKDISDQLTAKELMQTTRRHTAKNREYFSIIDTVVVHKNENRPPSPSARVSKKINKSQISKGQQAMVSRRALGNRKLGTMQLTGTIDKEIGNDGDTNSNEDNTGDATINKNRKVKWSSHLVSRSPDIEIKEPMRSPKGQPRGCLKRYKIPILDSNGNPSNATESLSPLLGRKPTIKVTKFIYLDDGVEHNLA